MAEVLVFTTPPAFAVILAALVVRLHGHLIEFRADVSETARTDSLTGLLNRRAFEELLELELSRARESGRPLSVVLGSVAGLDGTGRAHDGWRPSGTPEPRRRADQVEAPQRPRRPHR